MLRLETRAGTRDALEIEQENYDLIATCSGDRHVVVSCGAKDKKRRPLRDAFLH